jgi:phosphate transport system substrate-binding protein
MAPDARRLGTALLIVALLAGCGQIAPTPEPVFLRSAGSTTLTPLVADLGAAFGEQEPAISLDVVGAGTQFGLDSLRDGEAELALASWLPADGKGSPQQAGRQATAIARDGIAVIVHPSNPIDGLGLLQLRDLFGGQAYEWAAIGVSVTVGIVQPVSREEGSGTRAAFEALAMEGRRVSPRAIVATSSEEVVDYVASHREAIGYVSAAFAGPRVKMLALEGEAPTPQAVQRGSYPLSRELWLVTADPPLPTVQQFVAFCLGAAGQEIVAQKYVRVK